MTRYPFIVKGFDIEAAVRKVLSITDRAVFAVDGEGNLIAYNEAMENLAGYSVEEAVNVPLWDLVCPFREERDELQRAASAHDGDCERKAIWTLLRKDGRRRTVVSENLPLQHENGEKTGLLLIIRDITEVETSLDGSLAGAGAGGALEEDISAVIFRVDSETGSLIYMSRSAELMLGYMPEEFYRDQRLFISRIIPEYDEALASVMADAARGAARSIEVGFVNKAGNRMYLALMLNPIKNKIGRVFAIEGIARDITSRKKAEWGLENSMKELRDAYEQLQQQHEELQSVARMKTQILANLSHELRTPLVTIRGYNEIMTEGSLGNITREQKKGLEISGRNIDRLLVLIENLLHFARLEMEEFAVSKERLDPVRLMKDVVGSFEKETNRRQIGFDTCFPEEELMIQAEADRIRLVFLNVVDNAVKFSPNGGVVTICVRSEIPNMVVVEISDQGIGIPGEEQERVFESFYQVDGSSTRSHTGIGIGLALAKKLVQLHDGTVEIMSAPGSGTIVRISLPRVQIR